jgi:hypothetical protein
MCLEEVAPEMPEDFGRLVWARWFGPGGDLEIWRAANEFNWRFLGEPNATPPSELEAISFFSVKGEQLRSGGERKAVLWRAADARLASATGSTLRLLGDRNSFPNQRRELQYTPYYRAGVIAAVRYRRIREVGTGGTKQCAPTSS